MKGVSFVSNDKNEKIAVQIDVQTLVNYDNCAEDLWDGIIAELRKDEEKVPLHNVIDDLKKSGKLA